MENERIGAVQDQGPANPDLVNALVDCFLDLLAESSDFGRSRRTQGYIVSQSNRNTPRFTSPFFAALRHSIVPGTVELLLESGMEFDIRVWEPNGTQRFIRVYELFIDRNVPNPQSVQYLLNRGADPNEIDPVGSAALGFALEANGALFPLGHV